MVPPQSSILPDTMDGQFYQGVLPEAKRKRTTSEACRSAVGGNTSRGRKRANNMTRMHTTM